MAIPAITWEMAINEIERERNTAKAAVSSVAESNVAALGLLKMIWSDDNSVEDWRHAASMLLGASLFAPVELYRELLLLSDVAHERRRLIETGVE